MFSLKAKISHQPCLEECPELYKYYFEEDKICLNQCFNGVNGYIKSKGEKQCISICDSNNPYVSNGTTCSNECSENERFLAEIPVGGTTIKKCRHRRACRRS